MTTRTKGPWRVGVIGLGLMGRRMLGDLRVHPAFEAVAGLDADQVQAARIGSEFGLELFPDLRTFLEHPLDLVYVATPPASHVPIGREVLESGRPLFLEKPLAVDLDEARELEGLAEARGVPCALNFPFATLPGTTRIQRELKDGTAGRVLGLDILLHFSQWPRTWHKAGPWLAGNQEGGFLREVFSHFAYLTQRFLGTPRVEQARIERNEAGVETRVLADLRAGDVPISLLGHSIGAAPDFNQWTLHCEERSYRVEDWSRVSSSDGEAWFPLDAEPGESPGAGSQLDQLARMLRGEPHGLPTLAEGRGVMEVVEGLLAFTNSAAGAEAGR